MRAARGARSCTTRRRCARCPARSTTRSAPTRTTSTGTLHVLEAARRREVRRVVYASSSSVYGDRPDLPKREDQPPAPISPYAVSKAAGEQYAAVWTRLYGVETVGLRYFNVFGPRQDPKSRVRGGASRASSCGGCAAQPLEVHGDGTQSRDFTYIDNVVEANLLAGPAPGAAGESFNVGCGSRMSLLDVIARLEAHPGQAARAAPHPLARRRRASHARRRVQGQAPHGLHRRWSTSTRGSAGPSSTSRRRLESRALGGSPDPCASPRPVRRARAAPLASRRAAAAQNLAVCRSRRSRPGWTSPPRRPPPPRPWSSTTCRRCLVKVGPPRQARALAGRALAHLRQQELHVLPQARRALPQRPRAQGRRREVRDRPGDEPRDQASVPALLRGDRRHHRQGRLHDHVRAQEADRELPPEHGAPGLRHLSARGRGHAEERADRHRALHARRVGARRPHRARRRTPTTT